MADLITTPLSGANTYVSLEEANDYFDYRLYSSSWTDATSGTQIQALVMATNDLDIMYDWYGTVVYDGQTLGWPRTDSYYCDGTAVASDIIPNEVKDATCEHALFLLNQNIEADKLNLNKGIKRAQVGTLSVEYFGNASSTQLESTSDKVRGLLRCLGVFASRGWKRLIRH